MPHNIEMDNSSVLIVRLNKNEQNQLCYHRSLCDKKVFAKFYQNAVINDDEVDTTNLTTCYVFFVAQYRKQPIKRIQF